MIVSMPKVPPRILQNAECVPGQAVLSKIPVQVTVPGNAEINVYTLGFTKNLKKSKNLRELGHIKIGQKGQLVKRSLDPKS